MGRALWGVAVTTSIVMWLSVAPVFATGGGDLLARVNAYRAGHGLAPLAPAGDIDGVASRHAAAMAESGTLAHNPRLGEQVDDWLAVGENVGVGPGIAPIHDALVASAPHRANLLDRRYTQIGIGVVERDGRVWVVQVFRTPQRVAAASTTQAPPAASAPSVSNETPAEPVVAATPARAPAPAPSPVAAAAPAAPSPSTTVAAPSVEPAPVAAPANDPLPPVVAGRGATAPADHPAVPRPLAVLAGLAWFAVAGELLLRTLRTPLRGLLSRAPALRQLPAS